jgi:transcriptional regulator with XRE-family HTH domain
MASGTHAPGEERAHPVESGAAASRALVRRQLGNAIRRRRHAAGLTLATVSERAGISVSMLSQVERGLLDPSLDTLRNIADALGTAPFRLLAEEGPIAGLVRRAERRISDGDGGDLRVELLSPSSEGAFAVMLWELPPGTSKPGEPRSHPGEEACVLLAGSARFEIGDDRIDLDVGDCVTYDPRMPHRVTAVGEEPAACLVITCPPVL